jgi:RNase P subunit RPR2
MFSPYCANCRSRVLLGPRRIIGMESGEAGHRIELRCFCGHVVRTDVDAGVRERRELRGAA